MAKAKCDQRPKKRERKVEDREQKKWEIGSIGRDFDSDHTHFWKVWGNRPLHSYWQENNTVLSLEDNLADQSSLNVNVLC